MVKYAISIKYFNFFKMFITIIEFENVRIVPIVYKLYYGMDRKYSVSF